MANNTQISYAAVNAEADTLARLLDNGYFRIYDGTIPTRADDALGAQVLLAEGRFAATSAPAPSNGVLTFNPLTGDSAANAGGAQSFFRAFKADGTTCVWQGTCGASGCDFNIPSPIAKDAAINITGLTYTVARGA